MAIIKLIAVESSFIDLSKRIRRFVQDEKDRLADYERH